MSTSEFEDFQSFNGLDLYKIYPSIKEYDNSNKVKIVN